MVLRAWSYWHSELESQKELLKGCSTWTVYTKEKHLREDSLSKWPSLPTKVVWHLIHSFRSLDDSHYLLLKHGFEPWKECLSPDCDSTHCDATLWSNSELHSRATPRMALVFQSFSLVSSLPSFVSIVAKHKVFCLLCLFSWSSSQSTDLGCREAIPVPGFEIL